MEQRSIPRGLWIALAAAIAITLGAGAALWGLATGRFARADSALPNLATMPAFHLTDQEGRPVTSTEVRGKVLLVGFIYTDCDDICPTVTAQMRGLQDELAKAGLLGDVQLLSISVDPEYDTPDRLKEYASRFEADTQSWRFLTGDPEHVRKVVVEGFLLGVQKMAAQGGHGAHAGQSAQDYRVEHSGRVALVDRAGQVRAYYDGLKLETAQIVAAARTLTGR